MKITPWRDEMESGRTEQAEFTTRLCAAVSRTISEYAQEHPDTHLTLDDIRGILVKIIDYIDITDITGYGRWK
jgi:hypothetical protein